tara:strand:- start:232 stop:525 length:294 start_codon:yes stop_codon:yes gene_type:complete
MVELDDNVRMGLLVAAAAILIFTIVNMTGLVFDGDKLYVIDLLSSNPALRDAVTMSAQDYVAILIAGAMGVLYFMSAEDELDWEALLGDDDDDDEEE